MISLNSAFNKIFGEELEEHDLVGKLSLSLVVEKKKD